MSQGRIGNRPFEYKGFVHQVGKTVTFPSGFAKRELVLVEDPNANYKDYAAFEFLKTKNRDNTTLLDGLRQGQPVTVKFCLSANESKKTPGSWFGSARGIEVAADGGRQSEAPAPAEPPADEPEADFGELPF